MLSKSQIAERILQGEIGIIPTDTLYGVVCSARNKSAVRRVYDLKQRQQKPGTVVAASVDQLVDLGVPRRYVTVVEHFWPNPVSIVIPLGTKLYELHGGKGSVAFRIPSDATLRALLALTGPLLTTSANHPGETPASTISQAQDYFGTSVDFYVDGGDLAGRKPSTVIKMIDDQIEIIRRGAVNITEQGDINETK